MRLSNFLMAPLLVGALAPAACLAAAPAVDGARLYNTHCAACHGQDGAGGAGVPLSLPAFLDSVPDSYLEKTIRFGRPGRVMPSFRDLPDADIHAIVAHLRAWSGKPAPVLEDKPITGNAHAGRALFQKHCAACHGAGARGAPGTGVTFSRPRDQTIMAPGLANAGFLAAADDAMIKRTLMLGRQGTPMQSFLKQGLTEDDINDIVAFLRGLQAPPLSQDAAKKAATPAKHAPPGPYADVPILSARSSYSLRETVDNVKRAASGMNYRLIREQYIDQGMVAEGSEDKETVIVYFCNFKTLNQALAVDPRVGMFLPCRVTIRQDKQGVIVSSINPLHLSRLFNNHELDALCQELHDVYQTIIEEATL